MSVEFRNKFYECFREEQGPPPRRFIYYLRGNHENKIARKGWTTRAIQPVGLRLSGLQSLDPGFEGVDSFFEPLGFDTVESTLKAA